MGKHCRRQALIEAADPGLLDDAQVDLLMQFLEECAKKSGAMQLNGTRVLRYLHGMRAF